MSPKKAPRTEASATVSWKEFDVSFLMEVGAESKPHPVAPVPFADAIMLLEYVEKERVAFVQGSPGCGKSSLARELAAIAVTAREEGGEPWYKEVFVFAPDVKRKMKDLDDANANSDCLFIIDEAQAQIATGLVEPGEMFKDGYRAIFFGTTVRVHSDFTTPAELFGHRFWMFAPTIDRAEVRAFAERVLIHHGASGDTAKRLAEQAFDYVGASMGMLVQLLRAIVTNKGKFPTPGKFLLKFGPRVVVNGDPAWEGNAAKVSLAEELLAVGQVSFSSTWDNEAKNLLRLGFFAPVRDFDAKEAIVKWSSAEGTLISWAHSWQPTYCRICKRPILAREREVLPEAPFNVPIDALMRVVPSFSIESLVPDDLAGGLPKPASEYNFQSEFEKSCNTALPMATVRAEVRTVDDLGRIDFVVTPHESDHVWAIELVMRGNKLAEHLKRFQPGGRYDDFGWTDYLVLDCHTAPLTKAPKHNPEVNLATISPHVAEGWNVIVLDYKGKRVNVPRDTVPRYVADWAAPVVKVAVKLADLGVWVNVRLPAGEVISVDIAAELREQVPPHTIHTLKKALLAELKLTAKGPQDVKVYPPKAEESWTDSDPAYGIGSPCGNVTTKVQETKSSMPYHAVIR